MEIKLDKEANALYIKFRDGEFARNDKLDDNTIIDLDSDGKILGIELLSASQIIPENSPAELSISNNT